MPECHSWWCGFRISCWSSLKFERRSWRRRWRIFWRVYRRINWIHTRILTIWQVQASCIWYYSSSSLLLSQLAIPKSLQLQDLYILSAKWDWLMLLAIAKYIYIYIDFATPLCKLACGIKIIIMHIPWFSLLYTEVLYMTGWQTYYL